MTTRKFKYDPCSALQIVSNTVRKMTLCIEDMSFTLNEGTLANIEFDEEKLSDVLLGKTVTVEYSSDDLVINSLEILDDDI